MQHLGPVGQDLSYAWPGIVSRAFVDKREYTEGSKDIQSNPTSPTTLAALTPRPARIGSTVLSRGVVNEPQQR